MGAVTLRDVAREAGVSTSAVSRSLTEGAPVAAATRARILNIAERLGYQRNRLAAGLTTGRTRLVALLLDEAASTEHLVMARSVARGLEAEGLRPLLVQLPDGVPSGARAARPALRALHEYAVEAAVLLSPRLSPAFARGLRAEGVRVVQALARPTEAADGSQVGVADTALGREAARLLRARGYRRLGFLGGPEGQPPTRDRWAGFRNLAGRQGPEPLALFAPAPSYEAGRATLAQTLAQGVALDGWFAADDRLAAGALAALRAAGWRVPDEVGLLGAGGHEAGAWDGIGLTTLALPLDEMAQAAVELTLAALVGAAPSVRRFEARLIERGTLRPAGPRPAAAGAFEPGRVGDQPP